MRSVLMILVFALLVSSPALAHRVNIFAYVEGGEVVVECSFSKSKRVRHGHIEVRDAVSGETLLQGTTDAEGLFRFPVPEQARTSGSGLRILLQAGEGHQNEWIVDAAEFLGAPITAAPAPSAPQSDTAAGSVSGGNVAASHVPGLTRSDVEEVVAAALDAKLAPIQRELREQGLKGPGVQEIVGGIGWIFGLIGVAAYFKSRPRV
ncbi:MAG: cobalamin biosynthesis protein CbiL [Desulfomicrobium sp.]|nr:cobalamin biosynthesis protein CbiL [Pseudomonadota bacterium]MBV1712874.1 cobalamin biosynthesis protein CbiL [Desulfomicrobium sp.]MBU4571844.1 cobalamin biosynthesis protein CbiL [Pseudomonadota bacterium]MBU4595993.1 cobalamin biosynthesis protein CbiL [Pseudomonadota bacterium]MBV1721297.1 cobalamin biosynthesis protein CbiL [Desulfomicrobium sp.]